MTVQSDTATSEPSLPPKERRPSRRVIILTAIALLAAVLLLLAGRWWTHPTLFSSLGDSGETAPRPVATAALSTTVVFPLTAGEAEQVTLRDLEAIFESNTAEAEASFYICHMKAGEDPIGSVHAPEQTCSNIEPFEPDTTFTLDFAPSDYIFTTITPTRPGVAHLSHVRLTYALDASHLWQRGNQTIRVDRKIVAR